MHNPGELYLMGPYGNHVGRLILDPFSKMLYSSDARVFKQIEQLQASGHSIEDAIKIVVERDKSSERRSHAD